MLRGWTGTSRYLSERKQRAMLVSAGVADRVIYEAAKWPLFVKALRPGDVAVVADLRIFGSRKAIVQAVDEVEAKGAKLKVIEDDTEIHAPTLRAVDRTERRWVGERNMKGRASDMGKRGAAVRKRKFAASRLELHAAWEKWHDTATYLLKEDALEAMPGWSDTSAWRWLGGGRDAKKLKWSKERREAWAAKRK